MIKDTDFVWLNSDSYDFLRANEGYLRNDETVASRVQDIANRAFKQIYPNKEYHSKFIEYMKKGFISLSTPVWANFGRKGTLSISCFGSLSTDSLDRIMFTSAETGMMSKYGGGTSTKLQLRHRGAPISKGGYSDGAVHFAKLYDTVVDTCKQSSVRRGAMAVYLDIDHPDIKEFLHIKHEGSDIQNLFSGVCVTNDWLSEMEAGDEEKREIWAEVLKSRQRVGIPYIFYTDNANDTKPQIYKDAGLDIHASNLCVAPNTQILTDNGYLPIGELEGEKVTVWNGQEWSDVIVFKTGVDKQLLRVTTDSGYELDCTPEHKFYIQRGYNKGTGKNQLEIVKLTASELKTGDKLIKFDLPVIEGDLELSNAYENGFYSGDGCYYQGTQIIYLYGEKKKLIHKFDCIENWNNQENQDRMVGYTKTLKDKFFVPTSEYSIESRLKWLSGYLDADGTVTNNNGSQSIQVGSIEKSFLQEIQLMLQTLGCNSKVTFAREAGEFELPKNDGTGENKLYNCKEVHRLLINGNSLYKLTQLGLQCERLKWEVRKPNRECSQFIKIKSIAELPNLSDTYCFTEPKRNKGMFNGILTGQCSEVMLSTTDDESFVCCLSSLNAEKFDEWKDTDVVKVMTAFLDTVITDFIKTASEIPFMERTVKFARSQRSLGIGLLGYHSYLQSKMIPFESLEAKLINAKIFKKLRADSYEESIRLGEELGYAPLFNTVETSDIKRRNVTTIAVAPTSSSAFILGQTSQGIEPLRSNYYVRTMAKKKIVYKNPYLEKLLEEKGKNTDEVWDIISNNFGSVQKLNFLKEEEKLVFRTFAEISQMEVIIQASQRQSFIDQGQSINILVHPKTPIKEVNALMMYAYKNGIKSLYYQHSISAVQEFTNNFSNCTSCEA